MTTSPSYKLMDGVSFVLFLCINLISFFESDHGAIKSYSSRWETFWRCTIDTSSTRRFSNVIMCCFSSTSFSRVCFNSYFFLLRISSYLYTQYLSSSVMFDNSNSGRVIQMRYTVIFEGYHQNYSTRNTITINSWVIMWWDSLYFWGKWSRNILLIDIFSINNSRTTRT